MRKALAVVTAVIAVTLSLSACSAPNFGGSSRPLLNTQILSGTVIDKKSTEAYEKEVSECSRHRTESGTSYIMDPATGQMKMLMTQERVCAEWTNYTEPIPATYKLTIASTSGQSNSVAVSADIYEKAQIGDFYNSQNKMLLPKDKLAEENHEETPAEEAETSQE